LPKVLLDTDIFSEILKSVDRRIGPEKLAVVLAIAVAGPAWSAGAVNWLGNSQRGEGRGCVFMGLAVTPMNTSLCGVAASQPGWLRCHFRNR